MNPDTSDTTTDRHRTMNTTDTTNPIHANVANWSVHAEEQEGEYEAPIGHSAVTDETDGEELASVDVYVSLIDGAIVVQVDTHGEREVPVRVTVNDGTAFDETVA